MTLDLKSEPSKRRRRSKSVLLPERYSFICLPASFSAGVSDWSIGGRFVLGRYTPVILPSPSSVMLTVPRRVKNDAMHGPRMIWPSAFIFLSMPKCQNV